MFFICNDHITGIINLQLYEEKQMDGACIYKSPFLVKLPRSTKFILEEMKLNNFYANYKNREGESTLMLESLIK